jgi:ribosomal protein S18 acetylase RimI-like enzyme
MPNLRPMTASDLARVLELIDEFDDDDAEAAELFYERHGFEDQYVYEQNQHIIGVSGFLTPPGCDRTHWISWTYMDEAWQNQGHGRAMLTALLDILKQQDARILFVKVSDYQDEEDGDVYAAARHMYQSLGFSKALQLDDFYDEGENQIIYTLRVDGKSGGGEVEIDYSAIEFNQVFEIAETDDSYSFGWDTRGGDTISAEDIQLGVDSVRKKEGRKIFLTFPSNIAEIHDKLIDYGFVHIGSLSDYYEDGLDEHHYAFTL